MLKHLERWPIQHLSVELYFSSVQTYVTGLYDTETIRLVMKSSINSALRDSKLGIGDNFRN